MADWTQQELDAWLMLDTDAWAELRAGRVPAKVARGGESVVGCLSVIAALMGLAAGFAFGRNTFALLGHRTGLDKQAWTIACVVFFGVAVTWFFRSRWAKAGGLSDLTRSKLGIETVELSIERSDGRRTFLVTPGGRRFVVTRPPPRPISGRFRAYFIDVAKLGGAAPEADGTPDNFIIGLERA